MAEASDSGDVEPDLREFRSMRRFYFLRHRDVSGASGTGIVAAGVEFPEPNGRVILGWLTDTNSVAIYDSVEELVDIHGHGGSTELVFFDRLGYPESKQDLVEELHDEYAAARNKWGACDDREDLAGAKFHAGRADGLSRAIELLTDGEEVPGDA